LDGSCEIDISPCVGKFYAQFNNIMAVLGKYNNEMAAVHLTMCAFTIVCVLNMVIEKE